MFGVLFLLLGALAAVSAADLLPLAELIPGRARPWVMGSGAVSASLLGLWLVGAELVGKWRRSRSAPPRRGPVEPWREDHPWDPRWAEDELSEKIGSGGLGHFLTLGFFTPIFVLGVLGSDGDGCIVAILVVIAVVYLGSFFSWLYRLLRRLKYGAPRLRLGTCPFVLGRKMDVLVTNVRGLATARKIAAILRCVEERDEEVKSGGRTTTKRETFALWTARAEFPEPRKALRQRRDLPLAFDLPQDPGLATQLSSERPRYWELDVEGDAPGIDFHARFLVPVYADPRARTTPDLGWRKLEDGR